DPHKAERTQETQHEARRRHARHRRLEMESERGGQDAWNLHRRGQCLVQRFATQSALGRNAAFRRKGKRDRNLIHCIALVSFTHAYACSPARTLETWFEPVYGRKPAQAGSPTNRRSFGERTLIQATSVKRWGNTNWRCPFSVEAAMKPAMRTGQSSPLGAAVAHDGVNFSLYSRSATGVELLLFDREEDGSPSR